MTSMRKVASAAALASALMLGGCAYDDYGYGGVNVGYGAGYYDDYYPGYYGYPGYAPYGWYDGYYYPGSGYWLYDRGGSRHRWSDRQRQYWEHRRDQTRGWSGPPTRPWNPDMRNERRRTLQRVPREAQQMREPSAAPQPRQRVMQQPEGSAAPPVMQQRGQSRSSDYRRVPRNN